MKSKSKLLALIVFAALGAGNGVLATTCTPPCDPDDPNDPCDCDSMSSEIID